MGREPYRLSGRMILLLVCLAYGGMLLANVPCLFRTCLGVPCPGCGMRRALQAAVSLRFGEAFRLHPMFWSLPVLALSIWKNGRLTGSRRLNIALHIALALGFLAHYAVVLLHTF